MLSPEYLAGFFDGEGCIHVHEATQHGVRTVEATLEIANTHRGIIEAIHAEFGGSFRLATKGRIGKNQCWTWRLTGAKAERFARIIAPHSVLKREQLELFLELRATIIRAGRRPVSDETWACRRALIASIKSAKRAHLVPA